MAIHKKLPFAYTTSLSPALNLVGGGPVIGGWRSSYRWVKVQLSVGGGPVGCRLKIVDLVVAV